MQTRRVDGKVRSEHVASLGSVDVDVSVRERVAFWLKLPSVRERLGNRIGVDDHAKIESVLHARIPMVTMDEIRAVQEENATADERFWDMMHGLNVSQVEGHKALIAAAETKIAKVAPEVANAAEKREAAKDRLEKIKRGEDVVGDLGKPFTYDDAIALLKKMGFTPKDFRRLEMAGSLTAAEFETWLKHIPAQIDAGERASDRELRRIVALRRLIADQHPAG